MLANTILDTTDIRIPLKGIAIGNGWIDARRQYPAYLDYALEMGVIKKGTKVQPFLPHC
jgi:carboxypeptidase D